MHVRIIHNTEKFAELRGEWAAFLETSAWKHAFLAHGFLFPWWKHVSENATLNITASARTRRLSPWHR